MSVNLVVMVVSVTTLYHRIDVAVPLDGSVKPVILTIIVQVNRVNIKVYALTTNNRLPVSVVHNGLEKHATDMIIVLILLVHTVNVQVMKTHTRVHVHMVGSGIHVMKKIFVRVDLVAIMDTVHI